MKICKQLGIFNSVARNSWKGYLLVLLIFVICAGVPYILCSRRTVTAVQLTTKSSSASLNNLPAAKEPGSAPGGFEISFRKPLVGGNYWMDGKLCAGIESIVGRSTVVDFGAGLGQYGRCLRRSYKNLLDTNKKAYKTFKAFLTTRMQQAGLYGKPQVVKNWEGYDGSLNVEEITNNWVKYLNLAEPFYLNKTFDWVMSLEVGEHIPHQFEDVFLDNLAKHANKGIILSWAVKKQGGYHHINNQDNDYIISKMKKREFSHDEKGEQLLRSNVEQTYFQNTVMVFHNERMNVHTTR